MTKTPDPDRITSDSIAKAMQDAAWVAIHGTREERSGRFIAPQPQEHSRSKKSAAARR